jgi:competence protein ComEC
VTPLLHLPGFLQIQRGRLFLWVPVCLAAGIGTWFSLVREPQPTEYYQLAGVAVILALAVIRIRGDWQPVFIAALLVVSGFLVAGARAHYVEEVRLAFRYYGPVEGRIVKIDRSGSDKTRLTLDRVILENTPASRTPERIRVSLHGGAAFGVPRPGMRVMLTGHFSAPQGPVEPGGFDFARKAWFSGLGAVGYTRSPVMLLAPAKNSAGLAVYRFRMRVSQAVRDYLGGDAGAFAAAIMTGDRSGMRNQVLVQLRASNLAHLLAISGLHMGLLTGFVFGALRFVFALVPPFALRFPTKKIAAALALPVAAGYLVISGGSIATERAFIMVSVMLVAVFLDRRALTLRAVALAAVIVLLRRPESLAGPGFQMSFAATAALVATFGILSSWQGWKAPALLRPVLTVLISSFVAGAATAPVAAAHFNQISHYGLLANVLSVPVMGALIMPAAVMSALLFPFGLSWIGLEVMRAGLVWVLAVAARVAGFDGALSYVVTPMPWVLPLLAVGFLYLLFWNGRWKYLGFIPAVAGMYLWSITQRPDVLISESGGLIGVMTPAGRALSKGRGDGFSAKSWLENDGDAGTTQARAFGRAGFSRSKGSVSFERGGQSFILVFGRGGLERAVAACSGFDRVVIAKKVPAQDPAGCVFVDQRLLSKTGALAFYQTGDGLRRVTVRDLAGQRLWNTRPRRNRR